MNITLQAEEWKPPCFNRDGEPPVVIGLIPLTYGEATENTEENAPKVGKQVTDYHVSKVLAHVEAVSGLTVGEKVITNGRELVDSLSTGGWSMKVWLTFLRQMFAELSKRTTPDDDQSKN